MFRMTRVIIAVAVLMGVATLSSPAQGTEVDSAKAAIARGDGAEGARIIAREGYATQPKVLADIIYGAGVIAVGEDTGDEFSQAVADAFVRGGVSFLTAQQAFVEASLLVLKNAPTDEQLLYELGPGGVAIVRTQLAYFSLRLPPINLI